MVSEKLMVLRVLEKKMLTSCFLLARTSCVLVFHISCAKAHSVAELGFRTNV